MSTIRLPAMFLLVGISFGVSGLAAPPQEASPASVNEYRLLATKKTSTMQKEMSEAAKEGFRFEAVMGGDTAYGGSEVVVIMGRAKGSAPAGEYRYKLLATSKTSTMQRELQEAADEGFEYRGQTVFQSAFGGKEVVLILERAPQASPMARSTYRLLATKKTGTMQKELQQAADEGFVFVGLTVADTAFGGAELVTIMRRPAAP